MRRFDWTMTYRRDADVPLLYLDAMVATRLYDPSRSKEPGCLVAFFARNGADRCGRGRYMVELMKHIDVHAFGPFLRNRPLPDDRRRETKLEIISRYKFTIAFENSISPDYVTEKIYDALIAGSIPLYRGALNVDEFMPADHCLINGDDFTGPAELAAYLHRLAADQKAYDAYLGWKQKPFRPAFVNLIESQGEPPLVRLCHAMLNRRSF